MRWTCRWQMWRIRHVKLWDIDWYLLIWTQNDIEVVLWDNWINCLFVAQISQTLIKRKCLQQKCKYYAFPVVFLIDSGYENGDRQCLQWLLPISRFDTGGANAKRTERRWYVYWQTPNTRAKPPAGSVKEHLIFQAGKAYVL